MATETNQNTVSNSTITGSALVAGSHANVTVGPHAAAPEERAALDAVAELRAALDDARAQLDRRDDESREKLETARGRLDRLEEELRIGADKREPERLKKLLSSTRDALAGLTGLVVSADGLWHAVGVLIK